MAEKTKSRKSAKSKNASKRSGSESPKASRLSESSISNQLSKSILDQISKGVQDQLPKSALEKLRIQSSFVQVPKKWLQDPRNTNVVTVEIRVIKSQENAGFEVFVSPAKLELVAGKGQEARWTCPDGDLEIRFSHLKNPFQGETFRAGKRGAVLSGLPVAPTAGTVYLIQVNNEDGSFDAQAQVVVSK